MRVGIKTSSSTSAAAGDIDVRVVVVVVAVLEGEETLMVEIFWLAFCQRNYIFINFFEKFFYIIMK